MTIYAEILTDTQRSNAESGMSQSELSQSLKQTKIMLVLDGRGRLICEGEHILEKGNIAIIPRGIDYNIESTEGYRILSVSGNFTRPLVSEGVKILSDNVYNEGRKLAELILYNRFGNENYLRRLCDAYVEYILINLDRIPKNTTAAIYKIISIMEKDFGNSGMSVGDLLDESGYARDYIRTEFQNITKITPKKYLNNIRMKNAKAMIELYGDEMTISDIAERCGIIDPSVFSRIYRKHYGISPTEYRDSLKQK